MAEISIIVPVYRAESYLGACIDSILNQSFRDFELILVNDGSPDGCGQICEDYALRDSRIRVLHQENQGQAAARNHAMEIATGKWICFVDSDDLIHPGMVEALYGAIQSTGAAISMCHMLESPTLPENFFRERTPVFDKLVMDQETLAELFERGDYPAWVACAKLIPRRLIQDYPFTPGRVYEDNEAVCRWVCRGRTLAVTGEALYFYRTNPVSTTQAAFTPKKLDYLWALESILKFYREEGYSAMAERFASLYVQEAVGRFNQLRELNMPDQANAIRSHTQGMFLKNGIPLTKEQFEILLDGFHPKLVRCYWPLEGAWRTLRHQGIRALLGKICKRR